MTRLQAMALLLAAVITGCSKQPGPPPPAEAAPARCSTSGREYCMACGRDVRKGHVCGVTSICHESDAQHPECACEVGQWHVHGVTHFCPNCRQEVAANHMVNEVGRCLTRYCSTCRFDVVRPEYAETLFGQKVLHVCGVTHFCPRCMAEVAANHVCDLTRYCPTCMRDVSFPYCAECRNVLGKDRTERREILMRFHSLSNGESMRLYCPHCKKEVEVRDHVCFETEFCPRCLREEPLDHAD